MDLQGSRVVGVLLAGQISPKGVMDAYPREVRIGYVSLGVRVVRCVTRLVNPPGGMRVGKCLTRLLHHPTGGWEDPPGRGVVGVSLGVQSPLKG